MKTYALFGSNSKQPLQTCEGEEMVQNKEYVSIFKPVRRQNSPVPKQVQVAALAALERKARKNGLQLVPAA